MRQKRMVSLIDLGALLFKEDLVDPATVIKEKCAETDCTKYKERLDECNNRVSKISGLRCLNNFLITFMTCVREAHLKSLGKTKMNFKNEGQITPSSLSCMQVQSKNKTTETCFEEILDFYHCVDHCAAKEIFKVRNMYSSLHLHIGSSMCLQHVNKCPGDLNWLVVTVDYIVHQVL